MERQTAVGMVVMTGLAPAPVARDCALVPTGPGAALGYDAGAPCGTLSRGRIEEALASHHVPAAPTARHWESTRGATRKAARPALDVRTFRATVHLPAPSRRWTVTMPLTGEPSEAFQRIDRVAECSSTSRRGPVSCTVLANRRPTTLLVSDVAGAKLASPAYDARQVVVPAGREALNDTVPSSAVMPVAGAPPVRCRVTVAPATGVAPAWLVSVAVNVARTPALPEAGAVRVNVVGAGAAIAGPGSAARAAATASGSTSRRTRVGKCTLPPRSWAAPVAARSG